MSRQIDLIAPMAHDAANKIAEMHGHVHAVSERVNLSFYDLQQATAAMEARPADERSARGVHLHAIRERVISMHQRLEECLAQIDHQAQEIESEITQQREHLDNTVRGAVHAQEQLRAELDDHHHSVVDHGARVSSASVGFVGEIENQLDQLRSHTSELHDRIAAFDHDIVGDVTAAVQDLQHLGERAESLSHDLAGRLRMLSARFHGTAQHALIDEAVGGLERSSHQLHESLDGLGRFVLSETQVIDGHAGELLGHMESVIHIIDAVKPILEMVETVLG